MTLAQRTSQIDQALKRLEKYLQQGSVRVIVGATGAIAFVGWKDRDDIVDLCAYRSLMLKQSWPLKQAVMRAEALSGRKINTQAIAAGIHSHDGQNWSKD